MLKNIIDLLIGPALTRPPEEGGGIAAHGVTTRNSTRSLVRYAVPVAGALGVGYGALMVIRRARR